MSATIHPALRAQIDEVMDRHERRITTQESIDAVRDWHAPLHPLEWGAPAARRAPGALALVLPWRRIGAWLIIAGSLMAAASTGFLVGVALGILGEAVASR